MNAAWKKTKLYLRKNSFSVTFFLCTLLFSIVMLAIAGSNFFGRFGVELVEGFRNDGSLYFMVGKGIVHGLKPYIDLFETKGPFTFYLCALGYLMGGGQNFYFVNVFSFLCLLCIVVVPALFVFFKFKKDKNKDYLLMASLMLFAMVCSLFIGSFIQIYSGRVYCEMFCTAYLVIAFLILYITDSKKMKFYSPTVIVSGVFISLTIFTKEVFGVVGIVGIIFLCQTKKDFLYKLFFPFLYAGVIGVIFMACAGILPAYFNIYLRSIFTTWVSPTSIGVLSASPSFFERMFSINVFITYVWDNFSPTFIILLFMLFIAMSISLFRRPYYNKNVKFSIILTRVLIMIMVFFTTSVCLNALESNSYHQRPVATALYVLSLIATLDLIYSLRNTTLFKTPIKLPSLTNLGLVIVCGVGIYLLPQHDFETRSYQNILISAKESAKYIDEVLDVVGEERYQYIGTFTNYLFAYTVHDPQGPVGFQTPTMLKDENSYLSKQFKIQLDKVNVIVFGKNRCGALQDYVTNYIGTYFTTKQPEKVYKITPPESFNCKIYFRNGIF